MKRAAAVGAWLVWAAAGACGDGPGAAAVVRLSPARLDFGQLAVGASATRAFDLTNAGGGALEVVAARLEGDGAAAFTLGPWPAPLSPDETGQVAVVFAPTSAGELRARLVLETSAREGEVVALVVGRGQTPCGDAKVDPGEGCDEGPANGTYGHCRADCSAQGPRCGDASVNGPEGCDDGVNDGRYGHCLAGCTGQGPHCGDGAVNGAEACDDALNDGSYGHCLAGCTGPGPRCGDRVVSGPETCDPSAPGAHCCEATCTRSASCPVELWLAVDDAFDLWVDGAHLDGRATGPTSAWHYPLALADGAHLLAVHGQDLSPSQSGFKAVLMEGGVPLDPTGGAGWRLSASDPGAGWELASFDDGAWPGPVSCTDQNGWGQPHVSPLAEAGWVWSTPTCRSSDGAPQGWFRLPFTVP